MSLNPLRSLYDDINNILLFRTLQDTANRFLSLHPRIFNRKRLLINLEGAKETQILDPSSVFLGVGKFRDPRVNYYSLINFSQLSVVGKYKKDLVNLPWEMALSSPMLRGK